MRVLQTAGIAQKVTQIKEAGAYNEIFNGLKKQLLHSKVINIPIIRKINKITYRLSGDSEKYTLRVLLTPNQQAAQMQVNGKSHNSTTEEVQNSVYVVITGLLKGQKEVIVSYK